MLPILTIEHQVDLSRFVWLICSTGIQDANSGCLMILVTGSRQRVFLGWSWITIEHQLDSSRFMSAICVVGMHGAKRGCF